MVTRRAFCAALAGSVVITLFSAAVVEKPLMAREAIIRASEVVQHLAADIWSIRDRSSDPIVRRRELASAIEAHTHVGLLSRLVLGRHWRALSAADRDDYQTLFAEVVIASLAGRLDTLLRGLDGPLEQHFAIMAGAAAGKKDVLIRSKVITKDGQPVSVDWRLRDLENGPVIIDLVVEGVSLLVSQRAEFAAVIERARVDGLIETLRRRAAQR